MKILEIIFSLSPGGGERFVVDLCNEMSKTEDVTLLLLKDSHSVEDNRNFYKDEVSERVKCVNLDLPDGFHLSSQWKVYQAIKAINPDVVHYHLGDMPKFLMFALIMLSNKYKFVQTIHNELKGTGYAGSFYKIFFNCFGRSKRVRFVCISETNQNDMRTLHPYCDSRLIINGRAEQEKTKNFPIVQHEMLSLKQHEDSVLLLNVARCSPQKNHKLLVEAVNQLNSEGVHVDVAIIGDGFFNTSLGEEVIGTSGENVHYLGPRTGIVDYMKSADAFCLSSSYEGMPITLIEAMLSGVPMISTPVCGAVDVIKDGENGILSKDFSVGEYKKAILRFVDSKNVIRDIAQRSSMCSHYTIKRCSERYVEIFKHF